VGDPAMATKQYIAFLRAINVGGRVVKMSVLKTIFEDLALAEVSTFIASGNVIFASPAPAESLAPRIEKALQRTLGYSVDTMLRATEEVAKVARYEAFPPRALADGTLYVGFMRDAASRSAIEQALALQTAIDALHVHGREIYWLARKNISESTISMAAIEKALQTPATFRNINTVRRLAAKYGG
jgi:uncharacterized protein (DUF1697 family)